ncbi:hypothetical protein ZYGR_0I06560 [Zygosaccharomyces rouxii]|uniref:ZYRO0C15576p n=2 Tax=Zygosaccharomyces rouxii TaxID=4956 RepID=C5DUC1_ZYGRC|nr:uncharacterized protein ZYRO0C15576g [Zygosaccharomyces rouxii]KAH9201445.1 phosphatase 2C-like domain-containing protein [Zygosaccharomyces rouxii]GAV48359.1 hypothetical protein ZYGR_0I06560 [Zygosaccharomyces rouxii]CAR27382.1 ZYRO0C15576p [Zygosaccharomyces rouxii]
MSRVTQAVALRTSKALLRGLSRKNMNKLIRRTYFVGGTKSTHNQPFRKSGLFGSGKELNFALVGGGLLVLTYSYLSPNNVVSLDTVKGIRQFTSSANDGRSNSQGSGSVGNSGGGNGNNGGGSGQGESIMLLSDNEVNAKLTNHQQSYLVERGKGVLRYDISQLPSNNPIEDNHVEQIVTVPSTTASGQTEEEDLSFFGVFDGHSGAFTSSRLAKDLVQYVAHQLGQVYSQGADILSSSEKMDGAIEKGFLTLDNDIVYGSLQALFQSPSKETMIAALPAISGSCALLSIYNSANSTLKVALTGDSRALLCELDSENNWFVKSLSTDQTGDNPSEVERVRSEHPDEPNAVRNGRILGSLQPSRAFGDYRYKIKDIDGKTLSELPEHLRIYFRSKPRDFLTPPYVTAKPEITTTKIGPNSKFMVIGSDGLFELLSNEEVAGLVVRWMESNMSPKVPCAFPKGKLPEVKDISTDSESMRPAFRYKRQQGKKNTAEYLLEDKNVATHLIRNALSSGGNKEYVSTLVSIPSSLSRKYRDDLTVTVVFFGEPSGQQPSNVDGTIILNNDATTQPKPKL